MVAKTKKQPKKPTKARRPKNAPSPSANGDGSPDGYLPGMEPVKIEPVHSLAVELKEVRTKRIKLLAKEVELEEQLVGAMHEAELPDGSTGLTVYQYGDVKARITKSTKEKVKIEEPEKPAGKSSAAVE